MYISPTISHHLSHSTVLGAFLFAPLSHAYFLWIFPPVRLYILKQKLWSVQRINRFFQTVSCQFNCLAIALDRCQRDIHIATKTFSSPSPPPLYDCLPILVRQKKSNNRKNWLLRKLVEVVGKELFHHSLTLHQLLPAGNSNKEFFFATTSWLSQLKKKNLSTANVK